MFMGLFTEIQFRLNFLVQQAVKEKKVVSEILLPEMLLMLLVPFRVQKIMAL
jgi:hypothetical protein